MRERYQLSADAFLRAGMFHAQLLPCALRGLGRRLAFSTPLPGMGEFHAGCSWALI